MTIPVPRRPPLLFAAAAVAPADAILLAVGESPATLAGANTLAGSLFAVVALPAGTIDLSTVRARVRGAGLVIATATIWGVFAVVLVAALSHLTGPTAAGYIGATLFAAACYLLGLVGGLAMTSSLPEGKGKR